jgi:hypothetical protein
MNRRKSKVLLLIIVLWSDVPYAEREVTNAVGAQ